MRLTLARVYKENCEKKKEGGAQGKSQLRGGRNNKRKKREIPPEGKYKLPTKK